MNNDLLRMEDLVNNPTARVPVCLCLDVSGSMDGEPIRELNDGVRMFYDAIREDETALYAAEVCIITFGRNGAKCITDFASIELQPDAPVLNAGGMTPMGEAVNLGLDLSRAISRTAEMTNNRKLSIFPIGIGEDADMDVLARFSPKRGPLKLQGLKFHQFFEWLSQSVSRTSQSIPGESVPLDVDGIKGWAEL